MCSLWLVSVPQYVIFRLRLAFYVGLIVESNTLTVVVSYHLLMRMCPAVYIWCLHPVALVFQHVTHETAQLFAIAFCVVKQLKAGHTRSMKSDASSAKASGAKRACVLWLDSRHGKGSCIQEYDRDVACHCPCTQVWPTVWPQPGWAQ